MEAAAMMRMINAAANTAAQLIQASRRLIGFTSGLIG